MPVLLVDGDTLRIFSADGVPLLGACKRCGACCRMAANGRPCDHLSVENVNDKPRWFCKIYFDRSARCALWPQPQDPRPEDCGFRYEVE
jgi:hypothetical protein